MKRCFFHITSILLCFLLLISVFPAARGAETADFDLPYEQEALLSALYEADIAALRQAISLGMVSCEELTAYYLERIEAYDGAYNCFITVCDDALEVARQRDAQLAEGNAQGLLFGIPIVIKDNMDLTGYHTTSGHEKEASPIADSDAYVVERLLEEGAVIIAKANMSTDAQDARISLSYAAGETKNAYNTLLASGGSSGGSAVAASLNFAAASLGTDTNSSLRIPAALNGCVALRPTTGLISREGIDELNPTRDVPGAITRTVYDLAIMMDVLTDSAYAYTENLDLHRIQGLRIGILSELTYPTDGDPERTGENLDSEILAAFENAADELRRCGAEVVTVSMPNLFELSNPTLYSNDPELKDALYEAFLAFLEEHDLDAVIYPTYSSTPLRSGTDENGEYWSAWAQLFINNCRTLAPSAGIPDICVPIGTHSLGAGIGMEIVAPKNSEQLLLDIAYSFTLRYDHRQLPAGAPDTYAGYNAGSLQALTDMYLAARDAATAPTEPETQPTQPQTIPPTAPTEAAPLPTEENTLPATEPMEATVPTEVPPAEETDIPFPHWIWLTPLGLTIIIVAALLFRRIRQETAAV